MIPIYPGQLRRNLREPFGLLTVSSATAPVRMVDESSAEHEFKWFEIDSYTATIEMDYECLPGTIINTEIM